MASLASCSSFAMCETSLGLRLSSGSPGRCGASRSAYESRLRGGQKQSRPVHILGAQLSSGQEDEHVLAALKRGEHVLPNEERIAISDPFVRKDLQEVVIVDRAVRVEDVLASHLTPFIEDVYFLELRTSHFLHRSGD